jgi:hypothetical protein
MKRAAIWGVLILAAALGVWTTRDAWRGYAVQDDRARQSREELQRMKDAERKARMDRIAIGTEVGREEEARRQGWRRPGEIPAPELPR